MEDLKIIKTHSTIEERKIIYEWKINRFLSITSSPMKCASNNSIIQSPVFSNSNIPGDSSWRLKISYQQGGFGYNVLSVALIYCGGDQRIRAKYSLCIIDNAKNRQFICGDQAYQTFENCRECTTHNIIEVSQLTKEKDKYLPDDTLTISLELTELIVRSYTSPPLPKLRLGESKQIVDDLKNLFNSRAESDIVLVVGDKKIPAHKTLLMSRSPVFSAMFTHQLKENRENEITIPDMDPDTCEKLLEFIYTDNVTDFDQVFERLYEAADKYQISTLKKLCEESLCKNVNVENAVKYLVLLERHNAGEEFFNYILDFVAINSKKVIETPEFKVLEEANTKLLMAIVTKICSSK